MKDRLIHMLLMATIVVGGMYMTQKRADAQLIKVESSYRIVTVDRAGQRIGVALPEDDPKVRQSWIYIKPDTTGSLRKKYKGGYFKDFSLGYNEIFSSAEKYRGSLFKVTGGRDFDGSIDAKKVWF